MQQAADEEALVAAGVVIAAPDEAQQMHVDGGEVSAPV